MNIVDPKADAERIEEIGREMRRVEAESPRPRANHDMASAAIPLTRQHDRSERAKTSEEEPR